MPRVLVPESALEFGAAQAVDSVSELACGRRPSASPVPLLSVGGGKAVQVVENDSDGADARGERLLIGRRRGQGELVK